jgi:NADPH:quinone reductase-like Zn-dependent oxidoreductase
MKAAIVKGAGQPPVYGDFREPVAGAGESLVSIAAAGVSPLVRSRASGAHYSASHEFPFVVGIDGVGRLADGRRVYFVLPRFPFGAMAERTIVRSVQCLPLPDDLDDVTAAAIANPAMSSWAAFVERARLKPGETVLINGAAGAAGRLAIKIAKHLGAKKVIATARNAKALEEVARLGADATIPLVDDEAVLEAAFMPEFAAGVDVVIDYLWGPSARGLLVAGAKAGNAAPIRFVQVGSASGSDIALPSAALRAAPIELLGSGIGSVPMDRQLASIAALLHAAAPAKFQIAVHPVPLSKFDEAWTLPDCARRTVFTAG